LYELGQAGASAGPGSARIRLLYDMALRQFCAIYSDHPHYDLTWRITP